MLFDADARGLWPLQVMTILAWTLMLCLGFSKPELGATFDMQIGKAFTQQATNATASTAAQPTRRPLYYFHHVSKAAGSSFNRDVARFAIDVCIGWYLIDNATMQRYAAKYARGECNLFSFEGQLAGQLAFVADATSVPRDEIRTLLMLRNPVSHVLSMFAMCKAYPQAYSLESARLSSMTLSEWLQLWTAHPRPPESWQMRRLCTYAPTDFTTSTLTRVPQFSHFNGPATTAELAAASQLVQRDAFFVGVAEHYEASLCLLIHRVRGAPLPSLCACDDNPGTDASADADITHEAHQANTSSLPMRAADVGLIEKLASADAVLHALAVARLQRELTDAGLACLLLKNAA